MCIAWPALIRGLLVASSSVGIGTAHAVEQSYPSRSISMVVPHAAGGPTDTLARIIAERMTLALKHPVIVENVSGAAGRIGVERVVRATPDVVWRLALPAGERLNTTT